MKIDLSNRKNMFYWQTNRPLTAEQTKKIFIERYEKIDNETLQQIVSYGMKSAGFKGKDTQISQIKKIIKRGSVNSVIPVILQSGKKIVLRIHPKGVMNGYFWVERLATSLAKKQGAPTYDTFFINDSHKIIPFDFMITSAVSGCPMQDLQPFIPDQERRLVTETGKYTALIHKIKTDGFGFYINQLAKKNNTLQGQYNSSVEHIYAALDEDIKFLVDNKVLTVNQSKNIYKLFQKGRYLLFCSRGSLIHNDIADWNQLSDGKKITGIMDWDECFSGDPMMEFSAYSLFFKEPRLTWFKEGYNQISHLEDNEDKFQFFKLRYLISKMHLRKKRSLIDDSIIIKKNIIRGMEAMNEVFTYFKIR